ncbi:hypothetical protein ABZ891_32920 [Streptomyces sp. NPDC047023]|uniref:hypothetical protein n=1 Tax=Streptomyces sp. NPDC047023 TaxID=3155139 RepID=UPI0033FE8FC0
MNKLNRILAIGACIIAGIAGVSFLATKTSWYEENVLHQQRDSYATGLKAKQDRPSIPRWLPSDASDIKYVMKTNGGARIIKAVLKDGKLPQECKAEEGFIPPAPEIKADWFPEKIPADNVARCGIFQAYLEGSSLYAWQTHSDWKNAP